MKPRGSKNTEERFQTPLRHYHRANAEEQSSWEEWIHGRPNSAKWPKQRINRWLRVGTVILGLIMLAAVIIGLYTELS